MYLYNFKIKYYQKIDFLDIHKKYVEPAVNRQPGFRRELVEQISSSYNIILKFPSWRAPQV